MLVRSKQPIEATKGRVEPPPLLGSSFQFPDQRENADQSREAEPGRGRDATSPWQIPWQGCKDILWRVYEQMNDDRILAVAGGIVFYGLLGLFPALIAFVSLYGPPTFRRSISISRWRRASFRGHDKIGATAYASLDKKGTEQKIHISRKAR